MEKEFIKYFNKNEYPSYSAQTICSCLTQYAKDYIKENNKLTIKIDNGVRDAVLVDAINYLAATNWCSFTLNTKDLYDNKVVKEQIDYQCLLNMIKGCYSNYIFGQNLVESVLRNEHMTGCKDKFDINDGALVIVDFINYIVKSNGHDKALTLRDLYEKYEIQNHNKLIEQLRLFLESTDKYSEKLADGTSIYSIYNEIAQKYNFRYDEEKKEYHYKEETVGQSKMYSWDAQEVDKQIVAMAYAYAKIKPNEQANIQVIDNKILEMKK